MIREKTILTLSILTIIIVLIDALFGSIFSINIEKNQSIPLSVNSSTLKNPELNQTSISKVEWNKDIFYNRSNVYDSWFTLTGITKFENGYKAIINGEIVNEMNRVRGFLVKKITENRVQLERNDYHVTLKLKE